MLTKEEKLLLATKARLGGTYVNSGIGYAFDGSGFWYGYGYFDGKTWEGRALGVTIIYQNPRAARGEYEGFVREDGKVITHEESFKFWPNSPEYILAYLEGRLDE